MHSTCRQYCEVCKAVDNQKDKNVMYEKTQHDMEGYKQRI